MKMTRYSDPQILAILRQAEGGLPVSELCREHGIRGGRRISEG
jgi:putative transposase